MKPGPVIAQQLGPMGVNMGKVISEVNVATKEFKGMKVPVELNIDEKTKEFTVKTTSPPTSELLKKELGVEVAKESFCDFYESKLLTKLIYNKLREQDNG